MADAIGQQFGHYRLIRMIGKGHAAEVYLGEHVRMLTQAAVKVFQAHLAGEEEERFQEEARLHSLLTHPHIMRIAEAGVHDGTPFVVMDYAPNGSLRGHFPRGTPQAPGTILPYLWQVADALHFAHGQRLMHGDVKPENVLLDANNEVLLSDFAIPAVFWSAGVATYMAPEQIQGRARPSSDQYSLAAMVYEWLCGAPPFRGSATEVIARHLSTEPPPMRERVEMISPAIEAVVMGALSKDPADRFASVESFARAFEEACQAVPTLLYVAPSLIPSDGAAEPDSVESVPPPAQAAAEPAPPVPQAAPESPAAPAMAEPAPEAPMAQAAQEADGRLQADGAEAVSPPPPAAPASQPARPVEQPISQPASQPVRPVEQPYIWVSASVPPAAPPGTPARPAEAPAAPPAVPIYLAPPSGEWSSRPAPPAAERHGATERDLLRPDSGARPAGGAKGAGEAMPAPAYSTPRRPAVSQAPPPPTNGNLGATWREVNWMPAPPPPTAAPPPLEAFEEPGRGISRRAFLIGGLVGLAVAGGTLTWLGVSKLAAPKPGAVGSTPVARATATPTPTPTPIPQGGALFTYTGHSGFLRAVSWSPDGKRIASASDDQTVRLWDAFSGGHTYIYKGHTGPVVAVAWSPDGTMIASGSLDKTVRIWNATTGKTLHTYTFGNRVAAVAWSPDGKLLAVGSWDHSVGIWNTKTWQRLHRFFGEGAMNALSWSPDNIHVVSGDGVNQAITWNALTAGRLRTYRGHRSAVLAVAWSPDGKAIASGADLPDATVQYWNSANFRQIWSDNLKEQVQAVAWSPDGKRLAVGGGSVYLLNPSNGTQLFTRQGDAATVAWSPDGASIASGGQAGTVQVWKAT